MLQHVLLFVLLLAIISPESIGRWMARVIIEVQDELRRNRENGEGQ